MEWADAILPEDVALWAGAAIIIAAFFTSALTAAFGLGGGLALLAIMSAMFPPIAVIPIHGIAQLGSNASRLFLQRQFVIWRIAFWFSLGGALGTILGGRLAIEMPVWALRAGVAIFILYAVWGPRPKAFLPGVKSFFATGAIGGFLTMFFGATGPIAAAMLSATPFDRLQLVATHAACMVAQHGMKIIIFGVLGFAYAEWTAIIIMIVIAGYAGAAIGTDYLRRMPEANFKTGFNFLLTTIALYLLAAAAVELKTH